MKFNLRILYFCYTEGSGEIFRGLALNSAIKRNRKLGWDFRVLSIDRFSHIWRQNGVLGEFYGIGFNPEFQLQQFLLQWHPDIIIASQTFLQVQRVLRRIPYRPKTILFMRSLLLEEAPKNIDEIRCEDWDRIILIEESENETTLEAETISPIINLWPDTILSPTEGRRGLFEIARAVDRREKLAVIMHNGVDKTEIDRLRCLSPRGFQTLLFTSDFSSIGSSTPFYIAPFLAGVDLLIASPGYNTYWEWCLAKREDAETIWVPQERPNEIQEARVGRNGLKRPVANGADEVIEKIIPVLFSR